MNFVVTPFVGVWIETYPLSANKFSILVTPFVGVWIETWQALGDIYGGSVTPFVGVWIETLSAGVAHEPPMCHTLRGCVD